GVALAGQDVIDTITLNSGENDVNNLFGDNNTLVVPKTASITGCIFCDDNANNVRDAGELAIAGVTVRLTNLDTGATQDTVTDANGVFRFDNLMEGHYRVTELSATLPATLTAPAGSIGTAATP